VGVKERRRMKKGEGRMKKKLFPFSTLGVKITSSLLKGED